MGYRSPEEGYGAGVKRGKHLVVSFEADDQVVAQLRAVAEEREWTLNHVLRKVVPLGLEVYLRNTTLPHPFELSGKEVTE